MDEHFDEADRVILISSDRDNLSSSGRFNTASVRPELTLSRTESPPKNARFWNVWATPKWPRRSDRIPPKLRPLSRTVPGSGLYKPLTTFFRDDFPAPFGANHRADLTATHGQRDFRESRNTAERHADVRERRDPAALCHHGKPCGTARGLRSRDPLPFEGWAQLLSSGHFERNTRHCHVQCSVEDG